ncbi:hypothetical protein AB8A28_19890 [Tardiphaga sp. 71_E8_N1_1]|uniref:hypothetical protein n=1 Tax=Tardiphaga sp. 71_E8_N1_1 TaxID=3240784 RepID=UPI003F88EAA0
MRPAESATTIQINAAIAAIRKNGGYMAKASHNEKCKLVAAWFNGLAIAFFVAGVIVPYFKIMEWLFSTMHWQDSFFDFLARAWSTPEYWKNVSMLSAFVVISLVFSIALHRFGQVALDRMVDD